jgi:hypothetical protein
MPAGVVTDNSQLLTDTRIREAKDAGISDKVVAKALRAYEDMPPGTGYWERMRVAIAAVTHTKGE